MERGISGVIRNTIRSVTTKSFSNESMLSRIFQAKSSARNITGGGLFSVKMELSRKNYDGEVYEGGNFQGVSHERREFFMESEPDLPALFEKR